MDDIKKKNKIEMHKKNYYLEKDFLTVYGPDNILPEHSKSFSLFPFFVNEINLTSPKMKNQIENSPKMKKRSPSNKTIKKKSNSPPRQINLNKPNANS